MGKVSILGSRGSFHDIVAREKFPDSGLLERGEFYEVFEDVKSGRADPGIIAIENSIGGSILVNFDLLLKYDLKVVGEVYLRVIHNLMALPGVKIEDIQEVYSHPSALSQCLEFLQKHPHMKKIEHSDTASSARMITEKGLRKAAAIASSLAAEIYSLEILAKGIETDKRNYTRFLIISRDAGYSDKAKKTSLVMQTEHRPGSLFRCLKCFADEGLNLSKIESRPIIGKTWNYYFYMDFEAALDAPQTKRALECLKGSTTMIKILGSYERGGIIEE